MGISYRTQALHLYFLLYISSDFPLFSQAANTLTQGQILRDGKTIVSSGEDFELGFFSPANSTPRFVGIWYKKESTQTVIWVANRESPLVDKKGALKIGNTGNLMVLDGNGTSIWSSNYTSAVFANSTAILTDTGNLIISSNSDSVGDPDKALWQSFEDPTDTFLPGMRVHANLHSDENPVLFTSWTSLANPSRGNYSMGIDPHGSPQIVIWEEGSSKRWWRSGHWNGLIFLGIPNMRSFYFNGFKFDSDGDDDIYITYTPPSSDQIMRFQIRWDGYVEQQIWNESTKNWGALQSHPANQCELYNKCGPFGKCSVIDSSPTCSCIEGFEPKNSDQWNKGNWTSGCIRKKPLNCGSNGSSDGFIAVKGVKLPDYADVVVSDNIEECEEKCLRNCSCIAYAFEVGIQCMMWGVDLVDIEHFTEGGRTLFVRLANSELGGKSRISIALIVTTIAGGTIVLGLFIWLIICMFGAKLKEDSGSLLNHNELSTSGVGNSREFSTEFSVTSDLPIERERGNRPELPLFSFNCVADATNNFAGKNKLGEGGFGSVYKGMLPGGQEIAVKRLAKCSGQGLEEFKNEMILIAKLQHRSLVRLLGCCIEREEKLLIYEYMPNKSLDSFLFEPDKRAKLDWSKRFNIIKGIARGLLYLHRDSRLKIVHRDLKASNILLDEEMNPKISDFGMARIFGGNQNEANTIRVVGTYGYMSPEYAMEGLFSTKSDVYSFGILLLEIVSGQRSIGFRISEFSNLIRYAWHLWDEGKAVELIDPCIANSCRRNEVLRCIHVGMLCVQHSVADRPIMSSVVLMLESEWATLPVPRQPTFSSVRSYIDLVNRDLGTEGDYTTSTNDVTVTDVLGR